MNDRAGAGSSASRCPFDRYRASRRVGGAHDGPAADGADGADSADAQSSWRLSVNVCVAAPNQSSIWPMGR